MKKEDVFKGKKVYELGEEWQKAPVTKEEGRACKHRLERRWYRRMIEINILMIVVVISLLVTNMDENKKLGKQALEQFKRDLKEENIGLIDSWDSEPAEDASSEGKAAEGKAEEKQEKLTKDDIPFEIQALFYGLIITVVGYLALYYLYAKYRSSAVRITERNFPEIYAMVEDFARRLGIKTPKAYVIQQNGVLNAFSTFLFRKQWICIHAELFEVAYREHQDMDVLAFVIAHEMAHIYYGHATLHYNLPIWFSRIVPVFSDIASRTREYSCDRLAQRLTGSDGLDAMLALVVDRHLYKMVDKEDYIEEMKAQKGFFLWCVNMVASHPVMNKRVLSLVCGRGSGKLY